MTGRRRRMLEDLQRRGLAPRPPQCDREAVKPLTQHYRRAPDQISEDELRPYGLFLSNDTQVAERTGRRHLYGLRCVYERTLQRPWPVFARVRPRNIPKRPVVLSLREVRALLAVVEHPNARMWLQRIDACGLRLTEGTPLQVCAIEAPRRLVRVHQGQGGKDRLVPRASRVLALVRESWQRQRPRPGVFPARDGSAPLSPTSRHQPFKAVVRQRGIPTDASIPPLRHSDATHRLDRGVSLRVIQDLRGHRSPRTTARYTPLTPPTVGRVHATITARMADL